MKVLLAIALSLITLASAFAQTYAVETLSEVPPSDVAEPIRAELNSTGLRVKSPAGTLCDIWFRKAIPSEPGEGIGRSYPHMPEKTLIGAIRVLGKMSDNRANTFPPGVYVMRHGIQPQDGNHAGSADYIDFALLLKAKNDRTVEGGYPTGMDMIQQSLADGGAGHPIVFALLPPKSTSQPSIAKNQRDHWVLEAKVGDTILAIVIAGVYEH